MMSTSTLTWLDHDAAERQRTDQILKLFEEKSTVDELGVGNIRDSIADQLFPGTSTIQTRLRYFLFVPWVYKRLEERQVPPDRFEKESRKLQHQLSQALLESGEQGKGVIGEERGEWVHRPPDEVYWNGLRAWGIRLYEGSMGHYVTELPLIYRARSGRKREDEGDKEIDRAWSTWHPDLPSPPEDLLEKVTFALPSSEAEFIQDRIRLAQPSSLLEFLVREPKRSRFAAPWEHPDFATFPDTIRRLLHHARLFSDAHHGATLLYNILLARKRDLPEKLAKYEKAFAEWIEQLDEGDLSAWSLHEFWSLVLDHGYQIPAATRAFVEQWVELVRKDKHDRDSGEAHRLIELRELRLKGARARLSNPRALEQWKGASGLKRQTYRWSEAQTYVNDLAAAFSGT